MTIQIERWHFDTSKHCDPKFTSLVTLVIPNFGPLALSLTVFEIVLYSLCSLIMQRNGKYFALQYNRQTEAKYST